MKKKDEETEKTLILEDPNKNEVYSKYIIETGQPLYRGDTGLYKALQRYPDATLSNTDPAFFGTKIEKLKRYGILFRFVTTRPLTLIALDKPNTKFYNEAPSTIQKLLKRHFGMNGNGLRATDREKDYEVLKYICTRFEGQFDGYMIEEMDVPEDMSIDDMISEDENPALAKFHSEVALCADVNNDVQLVDTDYDIGKYEQLELERAISDYDRMIVNYQAKEDRKRALQERRRERNRNLGFSSAAESDESSVSGISYNTGTGNSLFGPDSPQANSVAPWHDDVFPIPSMVDGQSQPGLPRVPSEITLGTAMNQTAISPPRSPPQQRSNFLFHSPTIASSDEPPPDLRPPTPEFPEPVGFANFKDDDSPIRPVQRSLFEESPTKKQKTEKEGGRKTRKRDKRRKYKKSRKTKKRRSRKSKRRKHKKVKRKTMKRRSKRGRGPIQSKTMDDKINDFVKENPITKHHMRQYLQNPPPPSPPPPRMFSVAASDDSDLSRTEHGKSPTPPNSGRFSPIPFGTPHTRPNPSRKK